MSEDLGDEDAEFTAGFYEEAFGRFEELGEDSVWLLLSNASLPIREREPALVWLGRKARESSRRREAFEAAQIKAARRANIIAITAAIIAIASAMWPIISDIIDIHPFR